MTETKTCNYRKCQNTFERRPGTPDGSWKQQTRCDSCRDQQRRTRPVNIDNPHTMLGRYEVKSDIIDRFLYSNGRH